MSSNKEFRKAKHAAYDKEQEKKGNKVIAWIFGTLVALGIIYAILSTAMM